MVVSVIGTSTGKNQIVHLKTPNGETLEVPTKEFKASAEPIRVSADIESRAADPEPIANVHAVPVEAQIQVAEVAVPALVTKERKKRAKKQAQAAGA